jgi:Fic family protein
MTDTTVGPKFRLSQSLEAALLDLDRDRWLIENMLLMPKHQVWIQREVQLARAKATTQIEGIGDVAYSASAEAARKEFEQANANAVRAYEFIDYVSDLPGQRIDELVIRQINREFLHGAAPTLTPGVYRRGQNSVGNYTPPDQGDVSALMSALVEWIETTQEHPVIKAGLAHLQFVAIHPFWDGNGRTARGLETLVLQRSPYNFRKLLSMERRFFGIRQAYFDAIERTLGARFDRYDASPWVEFYVGALAAEVRALVSTLTDWHRQLERLHKSGRAAGLSTRQADAIAFILQAGTMTRSDYIEITGVSAVTASRDLRDLVQRGAFVAEGRTSARLYGPSPALFADQAPDSPSKEQMRLFNEKETTAPD